MVSREVHKKCLGGARWGFTACIYCVIQRSMGETNISGSCLRAILGDICCFNIGQSDGIPAGNLKTCLEKLNTSLKVLQDVVDSK